MLDQQDGDAALVADAADQLAEPVDLVVIEAAGRLVEQQQLRLGGERARELDALLRAERQVGDRAVSRTSAEVEMSRRARRRARAQSGLAAPRPRGAAARR